MANLSKSIDDQITEEERLVEHLGSLSIYSNEGIADVIKRVAKCPNALRTFLSKYTDLRDPIPVNSLRALWKILHNSNYKEQHTLFKENLLPKLTEYLLDKNPSVRYHAVRLIWKGAEHVADAIQNDPEAKKVLGNLIKIFEWLNVETETKEYVLSTVTVLARELPKGHEQRNRIVRWFTMLIENRNYIGFSYLTTEGKKELQELINELS